MLLKWPLICYIIFIFISVGEQSTNHVPRLPERLGQLVHRLGVHLLGDHGAAVVWKGRQLRQVVHHHQAARGETESFRIFRRRWIRKKSFPAESRSGKTSGPSHRRASHRSKSLNWEKKWKSDRQSEKVTFPNLKYLKMSWERDSTSLIWSSE